MIKLKPRRVDRQNNCTPILSDREIDEFAQAVLNDYKPQLLREPGKINYLHFLESYLGMMIEFQDIFSEDAERPILAMTAFEGGAIKVFDLKNKKVRIIVVSDGTVIFDNVLTLTEKECVALFTGLHEGGHILMHWDVYADIRREAQKNKAGKGIGDVVACRRENIESFGSVHKIRTAEEWREHHADYFAAAIAMPNATFRPFVNKLLRKHECFKGAITLGTNDDTDYIAYNILPEAISETYGVSKQAARIKLRKTQFVLGHSEYW